MIIIGYQGIGKSTLAGKLNCIDLESGNFWVDGKRAEDWYIPYCQIANHLSAQGYTVFVSSHEVVRRELEKSKERVVAVCPSVKLEELWNGKLAARYLATGLEKDFKAWKNAEVRYKENIAEILNSKCEIVIIDKIDYSLEAIVSMLNRDKPVSEDEWSIFAGALYVRAVEE